MLTDVTGNPPKTFRKIGHNKMSESPNVGLELTTYGLQNRCSSNWFTYNSHHILSGLPTQRGEGEFFHNKVLPNYIDHR